MFTSKTPSHIVPYRDCSAPHGPGRCSSKEPAWRVAADPIPQRRTARATSEGNAFGRRGESTNNAGDAEGCRAYRWAQPIQLRKSGQWEQRSGWDLEPLSRCCRHTSLSGRQIIGGWLPTSRLATSWSPRQRATPSCPGTCEVSRPANRARSGRRW